MAAVAVALAFWVVDATTRQRALAAINGFGQPSPLAADRASPTGLAYGQRESIHLSTDSYHWTMQAQQMLAEGGLRVREVDYDNAPHGREVHWASPLRWWVAAIAWLGDLASGEGTARAAERAGTQAGAWLLAGLVLGLPWLLAGRLGSSAAALLGAGLVAVTPLSVEFSVGAVDHHGLAAVLGLLTVLFLAGAATESVATAGASRRWVMASAICGAGGLWISASTQVPVLLGIGVAGVVATRVPRHGQAGAAAAFPPDFWRWWGMVGGGASAVLYLLEYFPGELGWRLEVNHPLHGLAWMAAGDWLARVGRHARGEALVRSRADLALAIAGAVGLLAAPAMVWLAGDRVFKLSDPTLWALHRDYIEEFAPLSTEFGTAGFVAALVKLLSTLTILPLLSLPLAWLAMRRETPGGLRWASVICLGPALLATLMAWEQKRWLHLQGALWLAALVLVAANWSRSGLPLTRSRRLMAKGLLMALLLPFPWRVAAQMIRLAGEAPPVGPAELRELAVRDAAHWLRRRVGGEAVVVLSDPTSTTQLVYHGGFRGVGTLYWENLPGLRAAIRAAGTASVDEAAEILGERGVTHLVVFSWRPFAEESARLTRGLPAGQPPPDEAFLLSVLRGRSPAWLRPLRYRLPSHPYFADKYAAIFEVVPGQDPVLAVVHQARYLQANGDEASAERLLRAALDYQPGHVPALASLAQVELGRRRVAETNALVTRIRAGLPAAGGLEVEDRVLVALAFAATGSRGEAARQVAAAWDGANERALRRTPAGALQLLLRLSDDLPGVEARADQRDRARQLLREHAGSGRAE